MSKIFKERASVALEEDGLMTGDRITYVQPFKSEGIF